MMTPEDGEMVCTSCGATVERDEERAAEFVSTESQQDDDVVESDADAFEGRPIDDSVHCDECGNGEAWYTFKQTASADEPPTRFFKCQECGHRWREYN